MNTHMNTIKPAGGPWLPGTDKKIVVMKASMPSM